MGFFAYMWVGLLILFLVLEGSTVALVSLWFAVGSLAAIVAALLVIAFYSSFRVQQFAEEISEDLDNAMEAIRDEDLTGARQALAEGAELCDRMREGMNHLLRTEDFTELEAALRAADGHLEWNAPEEAFGELRRAQVQVETLAWLAQRII